MMIIENIEVIGLIILAIYEVVARLIPTEGNWSIVHIVVRILDIVVKNKAKTAETDEAGTPVKKAFRLKKSK